METVSTLILIVVLIAIAGTISFFIGKHKASESVSQLEGELADARQRLLKESAALTARLEERDAHIAEAKRREVEAKERVLACETELKAHQARLDEINEQKGVLQNVASRLSEVKDTLGTKEAEVERLSKCISEAETAKAQAIQEAEAAKSTCEQLLAKEREATAQVLAAKDQEVQSLKDFIAKAEESLGNQFKALSGDAVKDALTQLQTAANQIIKTNSESTAQNVQLQKSQMEAMLQPVRDSLRDLNTFVQDNNTKRAQAEAVLMGEIERYASANEKLSNALNKPVIRGSWAETKLEGLLIGAGLSPDIDFQLQVQVKLGSSVRIVDALVNMPQGKKLVIDSKNLMKPFVEYANASDDEREAYLAEFRTAFRTTLKGLSTKDYSQHFQGVDAVIMFLPDEGMYMAAIEADRQLVATMYEHRVYVVSPISLLPILKSISYVLGLEKQNAETTNIADTGKALYESLGVMAEKIVHLGSKLDDGVKAYNGVVASFEGNLMPKARKFRELGASRGKAHEDVKSLLTDRRELKAKSLLEVNAGVN